MNLEVASTLLLILISQRWGCNLTRISAVASGNYSVIFVDCMVQILSLIKPFILAARKIADGVHWNSVQAPSQAEGATEARALERNSPHVIRSQTMVPPSCWNKQDIMSREWPSPLQPNPWADAQHPHPSTGTLWRELSCVLNSTRTESGLSGWLLI